MEAVSRQSHSPIAKFIGILNRVRCEVGLSQAKDGILTQKVERWVGQVRVGHIAVALIPPSLAPTVAHNKPIPADRHREWCS
jgi:hypothetical protein